MLENESQQKKKLEGEIAVLQDQLLQLSFEADEVCRVEAMTIVYTLVILSIIYNISRFNIFKSHEITINSIDIFLVIIIK